MQTVKMVISGAVNAGKTEFIKTISEIEVVSTERRATDDIKLLKKETTVAMDFGRIAIDGETVLHLYGTPGQKRFDFMWEILSEGMLGLVIVVDSTRPETFRETNRIIDFFISYRVTPYVVAANMQDKPNAWSPEELRLALRLPAHVKVLPCQANDRDSVKGVLLELLDVIYQQSND